MTFPLIDDPSTRRGARPSRVELPPQLPTLPTPEERRARRLADPELRVRIVKTLRRGKVPEHELEDLASETLTRACACRYLPDHDFYMRTKICSFGLLFFGCFAVWLGRTLRRKLTQKKPDDKQG